MADSERLKKFRKTHGPSKVNPDLEDAMKGKGGPRPDRPCVGQCNPQGINKSQGNFRAEKMDKGLPLSPIKKKKKDEPA